MSKLKKIIDIISIIAFMYALVMLMVIGFSILGLFLLGLKVVVFDIMFWVKAGLIFITFVFVVLIGLLVGLLVANGYELIQNWRNKRK